MEVSMEVGLNYARQVMQKFNKNSRTFKEFLQAIRLFQRNMIDGETFSTKVHILFEGHDDLIRGFHMFLPEKQDSTGSPTTPSDGAGKDLDREEDGKKGRWSSDREEKVEEKHQFDRGGSLSDKDKKDPKKESIEFLNTVRENLKQDEKYKEFLKALCKYEDNKDIIWLEKEVSHIFKDNPELLIQFSGQLADIIEAKFCNA